MFRFDTVSDIYKDVYLSVRKELIRHKEIPLRAVIVCKNSQEYLGSRILGETDFQLQVVVSQQLYGQRFDVLLDNTNTLTKNKSFGLLKELVARTKADFVFLIGEVWLRDTGLKVIGECIDFSVQSLDGTYYAQAPITRKGRNVKIPYKAPQLEPHNLVAGKVKFF